VPFLGSLESTSSFFPTAVSSGRLTSLTGSFVNRQLIYMPGDTSGATITGPANGSTCNPAIVPFPFH
jgi:hypothetical protein